MVTGSELMLWDDDIVYKTAQNAARSLTVVADKRGRPDLV